MAMTPLLVILLLLAVAARSSAELSAEEEKTCQMDVQKLMPCLPYAQKSASDPTGDCCKSVSDIRTADAACLCYLIDFTLKGDNDAIKSLNLDASRMRALPTVCKLQNTSMSDCPALLKLSPGSPDATLFKGSGASPPPPPPPPPTTTTTTTTTPPPPPPQTTTTTTTTTITTTTTTTSGVGSSTSDAYMRQLPFSRFGIYAVFVAVFFIISPTCP